MTLILKRFSSILLLIVLLLAGFLFPITQAELQAQETAPTDVVILIDDSPSMTQGRPDREATDPDSLRTRIIRFLIQYLTIVAPSEDISPNIGVITFDGEAQIQVPITPVSQWRSMDVASIIDQSEEVVEITDFVVALDAARSLMTPNGDFDPGRNYEILIFSDGHLDEALVRYDQSRYETFIQERIDGLPENVQVRLIAFNDFDIGKWHSFIGETNYYSMSTLDLAQIYIKLMRDVFKISIDETSVVEFEGFTTITEIIPSFQDWVSFRVISDRHLQVIFKGDGQEIEPVIITYPHYLFLRPKHTEWQIELQADDDTEAIAILNYSFQESPVNISLQSIDPKTENDLITLSVDLTIGDRELIIPTIELVVLVSLIDESDLRYDFDLEPDLDAMSFTKVILPNTLPVGSYDVEIQVKGEGDLAAIDDVKRIPKALEIYPLPSIVELNVIPEIPKPKEEFDVVTLLDSWEIYVGSSIYLSLLDEVGQIVLTSTSFIENNTVIWKIRGQEEGRYNIVVSMAEDIIPGRLTPVSLDQPLLVSPEEKPPEPSIVVELDPLVLGDLVISPVSPRSGQTVTVTLPLTVSDSLTNVTGVVSLFHNGKIIIERDLYPTAYMSNGMMLSSVLEEVYCNRLRCQFEIVVTVNANVDSLGHPSVEKSLRVPITIRPSSSTSWLLVAIITSIFILLVLYRIKLWGYIKKSWSKFMLWLVQLLLKLHGQYRLDLTRLIVWLTKGNVYQRASRDIKGANSFTTSETLERIDGLLQDLRANDSRSLMDRVKNANVPESRVGLQVLYFEKQFENSPDTAIGWLSNLVGDKANQDHQLTAGWCLVSILEKKEGDRFLMLQTDPEFSTALSYLRMIKSDYTTGEGL